VDAVSPLAATTLLRRAPSRHRIFEVTKDDCFFRSQQPAFQPPREWRTTPQRTAGQPTSRRAANDPPRPLTPISLPCEHSPPAKGWDAGMSGVPMAD
jgi:hypothetical protein